MGCSLPAVLQVAKVICQSFFQHHFRNCCEAWISDRGVNNVTLVGSGNCHGFQMMFVVVKRIEQTDQAGIITCKKQRNSRSW